MSRYVSLLAGSDIAEWQDEIVVLSPRSHTYVGFRGAARDVLRVLRDSPCAVSAMELARLVVTGGQTTETVMSLSEAEAAIEVCFQHFIDEGIVIEESS